MNRSADAVVQLCVLFLLLAASGLCARWAVGDANPVLRVIDVCWMVVFLSRGIPLAVHISRRLHDHEPG